ncbi:MAG TPA: purine-nucleoside phosphorylase, partial [Thermoanaerobaculia bacterium]|nr:purine-nucleoside phosphorylase [Thermoanaerobaculia bacterium]
WRPGELVLVADHLNGIGGNPLSGPNDASLGRRFPDMSDAYDPVFRRITRAAARRLRIPLREGVYVGVAGPSYETPAEIRMWRTLGADVIGMSTVPEVIALRHAGVRVLALSIVTNRAAGLGRGRLDHDRVLETGERAAASLGDLLEAVIPGIDRSVRT